MILLGKIPDRAVIYSDTFCKRNGSGIGDHAENSFHKGGLASAVRADDACKVVGKKIERHMFECRHSFVRNRHVLE